MIKLIYLLVSNGEVLVSNESVIKYINVLTYYVYIKRMWFINIKTNYPYSF